MTNGIRYLMDVKNERTDFFLLKRGKRASFQLFNVENKLQRDDDYVHFVGVL